MTGSSSREECGRCSLFQTCNSPFMSGKGPKSARVAFIGEAPGSYEDKLGQPFVGQSGDLLNMALTESAPEWADRRKVFITNAVRCRPPGNKLTARNVQLCQALLHEELAELTKLEIVVTFGNEALWAMTGKRGITAERGIARRIEFAGRSIALVPCYHPAFVLRDQTKLADFLQDMETAFTTWKEGVPSPAEIHHRLLVTPEEWAEFREEIRKASLISYDIETNCLKPWEVRPEPGWKPRLIGCSFSTKEGTGWFAPVDHPDCPPGFDQEGQLSRIKAVLTDPLVLKTDHNGQFEERWLGYVFGWTPRGVVFDSMIAWHMIDENDSANGGGKLDVLAARWTSLGAYKAAALEGGDRGALDKVPLPVVARYGSLDSDATLRLTHSFSAKLRGSESLMEWELRKRRLLASMEARGACVDWAFHKTLLHRFPARIEELSRSLDTFPSIRRAAYALHGDDLVVVKGKKGKKKGPTGPDLFAGAREEVAPPPRAYEPLLNVNSNDQLKFLCFKEMQLQPIGEHRLTDSGRLAEMLGEEIEHKHQKADGVAFLHWLADESIPQIDRDALELIQEIRQTQKTFSTYVANLEALRGSDGRLHTNFAGSRMVSWRVASSEPNLQNLPRVNEKDKRPCGPSDIKRLYLPPPGWKIVAADYSQLELRIIGLVAQDEAILDCFGRGEDIHRRTASRLYQKPMDQITKEERSNAKPGNFGCAYLMSAETLATNFRLPKELAKRLHAAFWEEFVGYGRWVARQKANIVETGEARSLFGHVRHLGIAKFQEGGALEGTLRQGVNFPIQCTASNLCLYAQAIVADLMEEWGWKSYNFLHVHDSAVIAAPPEEAVGVAHLLRTVMESMPFEWLYGTEEFPRTVPIQADVEWGDNLAELSPFPW